MAVRLPAPLTSPRSATGPSPAARPNTTHARRVAAGLLAAAALFQSPVLLAQSRPAPPRVTATAVSSVGELADRVWSDAHAGRSEQVVGDLHSIPAKADPALARLGTSTENFQQNLAKLDQKRAEKLSAVGKELDEKLAKEQTAAHLSDALKSAVEMYMVATDKGTVLRDPRVASLIDKADGAAKESEAKADWLTANELYYRLSVLLEDQGRYKDDVKRLGQRLNMIRLFVPEQFWKLRNQARLADGKPNLPQYNPLGDTWRDHLRGVDSDIVLTALTRAGGFHVDKARTTPRELVLGGLDAVRTLVTTTDLEPVFPGLADPAARAAMLAAIDASADEARRHAGPITAGNVNTVMEGLVEASTRTVGLPADAVLREFGDGAMAQLDDFSTIVWPDEASRFERMTSGQFPGVGVQIQMDEETQLIKVVTPIEGTPAQRAGIRSGDLIKKIEGKSAEGITLNQAVDLITGPEGTPVKMTMERQGADIDFSLRRAIIPVRTIKGWKRSGPSETQWDWLIDPESRIGYIRLLQFTDETTRDLHKAIGEMQKSGPLNGLILDLRFNPGGLLTQAVSVANTFLDHGTIVSTTGAGTTPDMAEPNKTRVRNVPLAVLINEGSASASEIVSGALKHYADKGDLRAVVVGTRSYGKGSVQNVWKIAPQAYLKLTTQYYKLPDGHILHRLPAAKDWGVDPHLKIEMLPEQITEALTLRQDADVMTIDDKGNPVPGAKPAPDPQKLLTDGIDVQLQYALVLLQSQAIPPSVKQVRVDAAALAPMP